MSGLDEEPATQPWRELGGKVNGAWPANNTTRWCELPWLRWCIVAYKKCKYILNNYSFKHYEKYIPTMVYIDIILLYLITSIIYRNN